MGVGDMAIKAQDPSQRRLSQRLPPKGGGSETEPAAHPAYVH